MAAINQISPDQFSIQDYTFQDYDIVPNFEVTSLFQPLEDNVEYFIYDANNNLLLENYTSTNYSFTQDPSITNEGGFSTININPEQDLINNNLDVGEYNIVYNFLEPQLSSSVNSTFYIKEISSDRTELRLSSNIISSSSIQSLYPEFIEKLQGEDYFNEFYLNFGENQIVIAINSQLDGDDILIKLYESLPSNFVVKDTCWVTIKIADPIAYNVNFIKEIESGFTGPFLKGPNTNIQIKDKINNSTELKSYEELISTDLTSSFQQVNNLLDEKGINIGIDYTNYNNFVNFSSAEQRLLNFYEKVSLIESASGQLNSVVNSITGNTSTSFYVSESRAGLQFTIDDTIKSFDGYERFLYFESESKAWPKSNSEPPYVLYGTGSSQVLNWLGSSNESSAYYGGEALSSSRFDDDNQENLINTIPSYLRNDPQNEPYELFIEMMGQHFDSIWIYLKDITNKYDADNRLNFGISKDLVAQAIRDLGLKIYQNQFSQEDLFSAFLGITPSGSLLPPTGSDLIETYVTASSDIIPLDDVNKSIYKRLYHNLPYLLNKKGTIQGIKALIASYGIPNTILRVSEFGGKDRDNSNDYDYWYPLYNQALEVSGSSFFTNSRLNSTWDTPNNLNPGAVELRINPGLPPTASLNQRIFNSSTGMVLTLTYDATTSGSYSGSAEDNYKQYGTLGFIPNNGAPATSASVYLPFFDGGWWSILLNTENNVTELISKNKQYLGDDGSQIGFQASASISSSVYWSNNNQFSFPGILLPSYQAFTGSLQELRYWAQPLSQSAFDVHVMNPESIEGNSRNSSYNELAFRLPLGGELYTNSGSVHPKVTGSWETTSSFSGNSSTATYTTTNFVPNTEYILVDQPAVGIKNRITDKVKIGTQIEVSGSEQVLSQYRSIEQPLPLSQSFTPDVNLLEVAFSPQNEINDDIISQIGYFNVGDYIGDPRYISSSRVDYEDLTRLSKEYFEKYTHNYDVFDYIRLIKYFDNSLFKMIKDFVPAKTSLQSGVVIKQHLLERNRYPQPQVSHSLHNSSGSISIGSFSGGPGGSVNKYNTPVGRLRLQDNNVASELILGSTPLTAFTSSTYAFIDTGSFGNTGDLGTFVETSNDDVAEGKGFPDTTGIFTNITEFDYTGDVEFSIRNTTPTPTTITVDIVEVGNGIVATNTEKLPGQATTFVRGGDFNNFTFKSKKSYFVQLSSTGTPTTRRFVLRFLQQGVPNTVAGQYYGYNLDTIRGPHLDADFTEKQFYNGEYSGSEFIATTQDLAPGCRVYLDAIPEAFNYSASIFASSSFINEERFLDTQNTPLLSGYAYFYENPTSNNVEYIRISKTDGDGNDREKTLQQLTSLSTISEVGSRTYTVIPSDNGNEFLLTVVNSIGAPTNSQNSVIDVSSTLFSSGGELDLTTAVSSSNGQSLVPLVDPAGFVVTKFNSGSFGEAFNAQTAAISYHYTNDLFLGQQNSAGFSGAQFQTDVGDLKGSFILFTPDISLIEDSATSALDKVLQYVTIWSSSQQTFTTTPTDRSLTRFNPAIPGFSPINDINFPADYFDPASSPKYILAFRIEDNTASNTELRWGNMTINVNQQNPFDQNQDPLDTILETSSPSGFINSDCDVLQGNADDDRTSGFYMDVDYSTNATVAVNQDAILADNAPKADVQDSNYTLARHINPRYDGSRTTSERLNVWTSGSSNTFGKKATIDQERTFFAYFDFINGMSPELNDKSIAHIQFLVDEDGNSFPPDSSSLAITQGSFETDNFVFVNLNDPSRFEVPMNELNGKQRIVRGGYRVDALLYTDSGSSYVDEIQIDTGSLQVNNYLFGASNTTDTSFSGGNTKYNWTTETLANSQWNLSNDEFTFSTDTDNQVKFDARVAVEVNVTNGTTAIIDAYMYKNSGSLGQEVLDYQRLSDFNDLEGIFNLSSGFRNFSNGDTVSIILDDVQTTGGTPEYGVDGTDTFTSTQTISPSGSVSEPYWLGTGSADVWVTASSGLSGIYGSKQLDVIPYDGTTNQPEFDPIIQNFTVQVGDEIRFKGAEQYSRMISDVILPADDPEGLLRIKLNEALPASGSVLSGDGYQELLNHFVLRRYVEDASYIILDTKKPLGSTSPGTIRPEFTTNLLDSNFGEATSKIIESIT